MGRRALVRLLAGREGTTAVEYAVLVALVLLACISGINALGQSVAQPVQNASQQIKAAGGVTVKGNGATVKTRGATVKPRGATVKPRGATVSKTRSVARPPSPPARGRRAD